MHQSFWRNKVVVAFAFTAFFFFLKTQCRALHPINIYPYGTKYISYFVLAIRIAMEICCMKSSNTPLELCRWNALLGLDNQLRGRCLVGILQMAEANTITMKIVKKEAPLMQVRSCPIPSIGGRPRKSTNNARRSRRLSGERDERHSRYHLQHRHHSSSSRPLRSTDNTRLSLQPPKTRSEYNHSISCFNSDLLQYAFYSLQNDAIDVVKLSISKRNVKPPTRKRPEKKLIQYIFKGTSYFHQRWRNNTVLLKRIIAHAPLCSNTLGASLRSLRNGRPMQTNATLSSLERIFFQGAEGQNSCEKENDLDPEVVCKNTNVNDTNFTVTILYERKKRRWLLFSSRKLPLKMFTRS